MNVILTAVRLVQSSSRGRQMGMVRARVPEIWIGIRRSLPPNFTALALISFKLQIIVTQFRLFLSTLVQLELFSPCQSVGGLIFVSRMVSQPCRIHLQNFTSG